MVEVGTTNKTHLATTRPLSPTRRSSCSRCTRATSGSLASPRRSSSPTSSSSGARHGVPVFEDQGSGVLIDLRPVSDCRTSPPSASRSPRALRSSRARATSCSVARRRASLRARFEVIRKLKQHPLARVLRLDKMTLAALEVTLRSYLDTEKALARDSHAAHAHHARRARCGVRAEALAARIRRVLREVRHASTSPTTSPVPAEARCRWRTSRPCGRALHAGRGQRGRAAAAAAPRRAERRRARQGRRALRRSRARCRRARTRLVAEAIMRICKEAL